MFLFVSLVIAQNILVFFQFPKILELQWFITFSSTSEVSPSGISGLHGDPSQSFYSLFAEVAVFRKNLLNEISITKPAVKC
jgi:hypothetical protein